MCMVRQSRAGHVYGKMRSRAVHVYGKMRSRAGHVYVPELCVHKLEHKMTRRYPLAM